MDRRGRWLFSILILLATTASTGCALLGPYSPTASLERHGIYQPAKYPHGDWRPTAVLVQDAEFTAADGTRFILCHMQRQLRGQPDDWDIAVFGHTHKPKILRDEQGRLLINPGETSGWTFNQPTIALLDTATRHVELISLAPHERLSPLPLGEG